MGLSILTIILLQTHAMTRPSVTDLGTSFCDGWYFRVPYAQ